MLVAAGAYADLVFHALRFVDLGGRQAASLYDPTYVASLSAPLRTLSEPIVRDAATIGLLLASEHDASQLPLLAQVFQDIDAARQCAQFDLDLLPEKPLGMVSEGARRALVATSPRTRQAIELLRIALALTADDFRRVHNDELLPCLAPVLAHANELAKQIYLTIPGLEAHQVQVSTTLGPHGRALQEALFVGTGGSLLQAAAREPQIKRRAVFALVLAVHEFCVVAAEQVYGARPASQRWAWTERAALLAARDALGGTSIGEAHAVWARQLNTKLLPDEIEPESLQRLLDQLARAARPQSIGP